MGICLILDPLLPSELLMSRHLSSFDIWQVRSKPVFENSKYCCQTCSSSVSVCNTYYGNNNFTTFSGVVYFAGFAFKGVNVCCIGDSLIEEFSKFNSSWTDCCNKKDNELVESAKFFFFIVLRKSAMWNNINWCNFTPI